MYLSLCVRLFLCMSTGYTHALVGVEVRTTLAVKVCLRQGLFVVCWGPRTLGEIACLCLSSQYRSTRITDVHRLTQLSRGTQGFKLPSSHWHSKHFAHWAIFSAPKIKDWKIPVHISTCTHFLIFELIILRDFYLKMKNSFLLKTTKNPNSYIKGAWVWLPALYILNPDQQFVTFVSWNSFLIRKVRPHTS